MQLLTGFLSALYVGLLMLVLVPQQASAQSLFSPAIQVNDRIITRYELQQRQRMLEVLSAPGAGAALAREQLIEDRLRVQAASDVGLVPSEEAILEGMTEFAGRANLEREEFLTALESEGVAEQTFRDFVSAGIAWRQLVQARFGPRVQVQDVEIDRALNSNQGTGGIRVLISEIIIPAPPERAAEVDAIVERIGQMTSASEFSAAAREFSATATRDQGGRLPWQSLEELPPPLRPIVLGLAPNEVSAPIPIPDAVALFQLRAIEETGFTPPEVAAVEYATYFMVGGRSPETLARARVLASEMDRCDDLYGAAQGQDESVLERLSLPPAEVPTDIAIELAKMDAGEVSTALTRNNGQVLVFLMLCGRTNAVAEDLDRGDLALGIRNRRLQQLADGFLAQLRADARIIDR